MPAWTPDDAPRFSKAARGPKAAIWSRVANEEFEKNGGDAGAAIRAANRAIKDEPARPAARPSPE